MKKKKKERRICFLSFEATSRKRGTNTNENRRKELWKMKGLLKKKYF